MPPPVFKVANAVQYAGWSDILLFFWNTRYDAGAYNDDDDDNDNAAAAATTATTAAADDATYDGDAAATVAGDSGSYTDNTDHSTVTAAGDSCSYRDNADHSDNADTGTTHDAAARHGVVDASFDVSASPGGVQQPGQLQTNLVANYDEDAELHGPYPTQQMLDWSVQVV